MVYEKPSFMLISLNVPTPTSKFNVDFFVAQFAVNLVMIFCNDISRFARVAITISLVLAVAYTYYHLN